MFIIGAPKIIIFTINFPLPSEESQSQDPTKHTFLSVDHNRRKIEKNIHAALRQSKNYINKFVPDAARHEIATLPTELILADILEDAGNWLRLLSVPPHVWCLINKTKSNLHDKIHPHDLA